MSAESVPPLVLIVDDNSINRFMLVQHATQMKLRTITAEDGLLALEQLRKTPIDLVLLDLLMPNLDGHGVLQQMKADPELRHIPVLIVSAVDELASVVQCIEMGAADYLTKPFNPVVLRARVNACLEKKKLHDQERDYLRQIEQEKQRADELLRVILPGEVIGELKATGTVQPRRYPAVAVMFADIVGFTAYCERQQPEQVVDALQHLVEEWERIAVRNDVQKIKTIGDAFMAAAGILRASENPVLQCIRCGLEMLTALHHSPMKLDARIGIHIGPVIAGVVGSQQYLFDLWGDTVNTAQRIESHGQPSSITLSKEALQHVKTRCAAEALGLMQVKGKGQLEMFRFLHFVGAEELPASH